VEGNREQRGRKWGTTWKEMGNNVEGNGNNVEDKVRAFVSDLLCQYIQDFSKIVWTYFKSELLISEQRRKSHLKYILEWGLSFLGV
jgi:hypothetical protein